MLWSPHILSILLVASGTQAETFDGWDNVESIDDGYCAESYPEANVNLKFINEHRPGGGFYLGSLNSKLEEIKIARAILGRNLTQDDDRRYYCPRIDWRTSDDWTLITGKLIGFGKNSTGVTCAKLDPLANKQACRLVKATKALFRPDAYWTLTDQETYVVVVRCSKNRKKTFNVLSTKPVLEKKVKEKIGAHVQELGFNPKNFNVVDFSLC